MGKKLTGQEKNLLKQAKLLMIRADKQEKSHNKNIQKQAEQTRQQLASVLTQLHIIDDMDRDEDLTQLWDDWCITRKNPHTGHQSCADRILFYVQQQGVYEGTLRRLANAVGAAKSTVHEALKHLVEEHKISVDQTDPDNFLMVAL